MAGVDWSIPVDTSNTYLGSLLSSWSSISLGTNSLYVFGPKLGAAWFVGLVFGLTSLVGGPLIAQKLLLSGSLFASIGMFYFVIKHVSTDLRISWLSAIIYAYSPTFSNNIGTGLIWGMVFVPIATHFLLRMLETGGIIHSFYFAVSYSVSSAFGNYNLLLIPVIGLIWILVAGGIRGFVDPRRIVKTTATSFLFVMLANPFAVEVLWRLLDGSYFAAQLIPRFSINEFYSNYSWLTIRGSLTFDPWVYFSLVRPIGFLMPIVAVSSLFLARNRNQKIGTIVCAILYVSIIGFIELVRIQSPVFSFIYSNFPLISLLRGPHGLLNILGFLVAWMTAISLSGLLYLAKVYSMSRKQGSKLGTLRSTNFIATLTIFLILLSFFSYNPVFHPRLQTAGQGSPSATSGNLIPFPDTYHNLVEWMRQQGSDGSFRYILVPTPFTSFLSLPFEYPYSLGPVYGGGPKDQYILNSQQALLDGTSNWGKILAPAGVRYVVYLNGTGIDEPELVSQFVKGPPSVSFAGALSGDPKYYRDLLMMQSDLHLLKTEAGYQVYQNDLALPKLAAYAQAIMVLGNYQELEKVTSLPNFSPQDMMVLFSDGQQGLPRDVLDSVQAVFTEGQSPYDANLADKPLIYYVNSSRVSFLEDRPVVINENGTALVVQVTNTDISDWRAGFAGNLYINQSHTAAFTFTTAPLAVGESWQETFNLQLTPGNEIFVTNSLGNRASNVLVWDENNKTKNVFGSLQKVPIQVARSGDYLLLIQAKIGSRLPSIIEFGNANRTVAPLREAAGWFGSTSFPLNPGSFTVDFGLQPGVKIKRIVLISTEAWDVLHSSVAKITVQPKEIGIDRYKLSLQNSRPVLLALSESYDPSWIGSVGSRIIPHFIGYGFLNLYYVQTNHAEVELRYVNPRSIILSWIGFSTFVVASVLLVIQKLGAFYFVRKRSKGL